MTDREEQLFQEKDNISKEYDKVVDRLMVLVNSKSKEKEHLLRREHELNSRSYKVRVELSKFGHKFALENPCPLMSTKSCEECTGHYVRINGKPRMVKPREGSYECALKKVPLPF